MGIINIDEGLHEQVRKASKVACRSINAQAEYWMKVGMLCETDPDLSFAHIIAREMKAAGVQVPSFHKKIT